MTAAFPMARDGLCPATSKRCETREEATATLVAYRQTRLPGSPRRRVYQCPSCGAWHTTSHSKVRTYPKRPKVSYV